MFALYLKTKNFHWHMSGHHFRDYHLLLDEHGEQIFAMTDDIAERARKIGGTTLRSISEVSKHQRLKDNNAEFVEPLDMMSELRADNLNLTRSMRATHEVCEKYNDVATASLIEVWIDQTERRTWFLSEIVAGEVAAELAASGARISKGLLIWRGDLCFWWLVDPVEPSRLPPRVGWPTVVADHVDQRGLAGFERALERRNDLLGSRRFRRGIPSRQRFCRSGCSAAC